MCGIVGMAGRHDLDWVHRMNAAITHRGPDDLGVYHSQEQSVTLAMRRLSILDLAGGHQPMVNDDGTIWIVFNGEIYNSPELRRELEAEGRRFRTANSDTEVLLHLYEERGEGFLNQLNGMFAFVRTIRERSVCSARATGSGSSPGLLLRQRPVRVGIRAEGADHPPMDRA